MTVLPAPADVARLTGLRHHLRWSAFWDQYGV